MRNVFYFVSINNKFHTEEKKILIKIILLKFFNLKIFSKFLPFLLLTDIYVAIYVVNHFKDY